VRNSTRMRMTALLLSFGLSSPQSTAEEVDVFLSGGAADIE
jgi:hypothetical protein